MAKRELAAANSDRARLELEFEQPYLLGPLFGDYDRHLIMIEDRLGVNVAARGNRVMIEGEPEAAARARDVLVGLYNRSTRARMSTPPRFEALIGMANQPALEGIIATKVASPPTGDDPNAQERRSSRGRRRQTRYMECLARDDMIFALGPAGTGKTYLAVAQAVSQLVSGSVDRLILSRPGGRGWRAPRLPARRHEGEGRSLSPPALRRALRYAADRSRSSGASPRAKSKSRRSPSCAAGP
jgi:phosphate starvation-inducible PhoH-like protein